jgi:hypothetical protein
LGASRVDVRFGSIFGDPQSNAVHEVKGPEFEYNFFKAFSLTSKALKHCFSPETNEK